MVSRPISCAIKTSKKLKNLEHDVTKNSKSEGFSLSEYVLSEWVQLQEKGKRKQSMIYLLSTISAQLSVMLLCMKRKNVFWGHLTTCFYLLYILVIKKFFSFFYKSLKSCVFKNFQFYLQFYMDFHGRFFFFLLEDKMKKLMILSACQFPSLIFDSWQRYGEHWA